jgi:pyridoxine 5'-phosphate synthase PdxJ
MEDVVTERTSIEAYFKALAAGLISERQLICIEGFYALGANDVAAFELEDWWTGKYGKGHARHKNVMTQRISELRRAGVVVKRTEKRLNPETGHRVNTYGLTGFVPTEKIAKVTISKAKLAAAVLAYNEQKLEYRELLAMARLALA